MEDQNDQNKPAGDDPFRGEAAGDQKVPKFQTTTVGKLGAVLPLGPVGQDGKHQRLIAVRPWRMKEEKILGRRREQNEKQNMGKYVGIVLSTMCTKLAGQTWDDLKDDDTADRELTVSQMWMADVFYAYVYLRIQAMGNELAMDLTSPYKPGLDSFPFTGDLNTVEVKVPASLDDCMWTYTLLDPFKIRNVEARSLVMGPGRWYNVEQMGDTTTGAAKAMVIHSCIHAVPDIQEGEIALAESEIDEMSKRDLEHLADRIDKNGFGPQMQIEAVCPYTKRTFKSPIDWRFDQFFGISSPSPD